ncbi:hypothetical protein WME98_09725 [Sorangium sp. So ce296]|uniref:hypothetical protein n=1 Tax=Sorangium sp. So ce296 TaxID=3133296 RepID=UPI003F647455
MSDNITLPQGAGTILATDEILGVHVLRAKVQTGADGTAVDVSQSNPLPAGLVGALPAGTNIVGAVHVKPATAGGLSIYRTLSPGTTGVNLKDSPGQVFGWHISNTGASGVYVKLYNMTEAPGNMSNGSLVMTLYVPAGQITSVEHTNGIAFTIGIGLRATAGVSDTDNTAPTANSVIVNLFYK